MDCTNNERNPFRLLATQYLHASYPEPRRSTQVSSRVYKAHFKLSPVQTARVWDKLGYSLRGMQYVHTTNENTPQRVDYDNDIMPIHLLWALHYMKNYDTEDQSAVLFGTTSKTFRKYF